MLSTVTFMFTIPPLTISLLASVVKRLVGSSFHMMIKLQSVILSYLYLLIDVVSFRSIKHPVNHNI